MIRLVDLGVLEGVGAREMTTTDVEYTVKIQFVASEFENKLMSEFCCVSTFLEIFILLFFFFWHLLFHSLPKAVMQLVDSYNYESKWIISAFLKLTAKTFQY